MVKFKISSENINVAGTTTTIMSHVVVSWVVDDENKLEIRFSLYVLLTSFTHCKLEPCCVPFLQDVHGQIEDGLLILSVRLL